MTSGTARPTIKTIAADLGISHMTVSRALSGGSGVSPATRELVESRALELGYVGSQAARTIRGEPSRVLGLSLPNLRNEFYAALANRVAERAVAGDVQVMIGLTLDDPSREAIIIRQFLAQRVGMIAMVPAPDGGIAAETGDTQILELVRQRGGLAGGFLGIDDGPAISAAVRALAAAGHRRIGFIGAHPSLSTGRTRRQAFDTAAIEHGLPLDFARSVSPSEGEGAEALRLLLGDGVAPSAVVLGGVEISKGALRYSIESGAYRHVPLELVAYGDPQWVRWIRPGMSAISLPEAALAEAVVSRFIEASHADASTQPAAPVWLEARLVRATLIGGPA